MTMMQSVEKSVSNSLNNDHWWDEINGIGQKRAEWLRNEFNVSSVDDFAAVSIDEIELRIQEKNNIRWRRDEIESSITLAQEIIAKDSNLSPQNMEHKIFQADVNVNTTNQMGTWDYIAAYSVEFRTPKNMDPQKEPEINVRPIDITQDGTWVDIKGEGTVIGGKNLYEWMLNHLSGEATFKQDKIHQVDTQVDFQVQKTTADVRVETVDVQAYQSPHVKTPTAIGKRDKPFQGFLKGNEPFDLLISFDLIGSDADNFSQNQFPYHAQFYARDLSSGKHIHLGDTLSDTLVQSQTSYTAVLPKASLMPGMYRMQALVKVRNFPPIAGVIDVPMLQVV